MNSNLDSTAATNSKPGGNVRREPHQDAEHKVSLGARLAGAVFVAFEFLFPIFRTFSKRRMEARPLAAATSSDPSPLNPPASHSDSTLESEFGSSNPIPPRTLDRNLDAERRVNRERRAFWGTLLAALMFVVALAGSIVFLVAYWSDLSNPLLGASLAIAFGGWGAMLVIWARMLTVQREAIAPRESLVPPQTERNAAAEAFTFGARDVSRRSILRWIGYTATALFAAMAASLLRSLGVPSYSSLNTHIWKRGQRLMTAEGEPVSVASMQTGSILTVFPEGSIGDERSQTILIRVNPSLLELPKERENWAPDGILAYSRVCTHAGCTVGLYEKTSHLLMCPCHQSTFNVLRAARPNSGPAARALPQLPIYADSDGTLRAGDGFTEPPGPGFWGIE